MVCFELKLDLYFNFMRCYTCIALENSESAQKQMQATKKVYLSRF